jgi:hypothetical protein
MNRGQRRRSSNCFAGRKKERGPSFKKNERGPESDIFAASDARARVSPKTKEREKNMEFNSEQTGPEGKKQILQGCNCNHPNRKCWVIAHPRVWSTSPSSSAGCSGPNLPDSATAPCAHATGSEVTTRPPPCPPSHSCFPYGTMDPHGRQTPEDGFFHPRDADLRSPCPHTTSADLLCF